MGFASAYLEEKTLFPPKTDEAPDKDTGIIVVVPAYNEPGIVSLLDSLLACSEPQCRVEVIIVINAPANATTEAKGNNLTALNNIQSWKSKHNDCFFRLFAFSTGEHSISGWGVGLARKTGMDEAVRRFNAICKPDGVILNLDADCSVEKNYLQAVCDKLCLKKNRTACSIYFEHPLSDGYDSDILKYITLYELHLRYYYQGLAYSGFPYVFHTVGSAMAVKALAYVKAGGMNRRQAGEDFYFIQKLVPSGGYFNLNSTTVYPSPRSSDRVPFGTGASIGKMSADKSDVLMTYNPLAFKDLRLFFGSINNIFECSNDEIRNYFKTIPGSLQLFLVEEDWIEKMIEIKNNTSGIISFKKRFYDWFNMFKIVKYLNFVHADYFEKKAVDIAAAEMLEFLEDSFKSKDPEELLKYFRSLEKNKKEEELTQSRS